MDCVFCRIVSGVTRPTDHVPTIIDRSYGVVAFEPLNPVVPGGHILVVPTVHVADFMGSATVTAESARFAARLADARDGDWNLITSAGPAATQTVNHLHWHLVQRSAGDGLHLPWTGQAPAQHTKEA